MFVNGEIFFYFLCSFYLEVLLKSWLIWVILDFFCIIYVFNFVSCFLRCCIQFIFFSFLSMNCRSFFIEIFSFLIIVFCSFVIFLDFIVVVVVFKLMYLGREVILLFFIRSRKLKLFLELLFIILIKFVFILLFVI